MAMEVKKVNELEENNKVSKLIGMDDAGNMFSAVSEAVVAKALFRSVSKKGYASVFIFAGIAEISTSKGRVVYVYLSEGILLGNTQYYTTDEQGAIDNKKIFVGVIPGAGYLSVDDYTGENLTISISALGFTEEAHSSLL